MLFLHGNLGQSVLWEPQIQITDKMDSANDMPEQISKRVHSCFNFLIELRSLSLILGQILCNASCRIQQSGKVTVQVSVMIQDLALNNFWVQNQ